MDKRPHLLVGVPSKSGDMSVEVHRYLTGLQMCAAADLTGFTVSEGILTGISPVQFARNVLMGQAKACNADAILMIDADMIPEPTVSRLLFIPAAIVAARMFRFRHHGENGENTEAPEIATCATVLRGEERVDLIPKVGSDAIERVHAVGTGCTLIRRAVWEDERMHVGPAETVEGYDFPIPALFRMVQTQTGRITDWEDVDFSLRASQLGHEVVVDFGAHCGHRKAINLDAVHELIYSKKEQPCTV